MIQAWEPTKSSGCAWGFTPATACAMARSLCWRRSRRAQMKELDELLGYAAEAVESIIAEGVEKAMTRFNRRAQGLNTEEE